MLNRNLDKKGIYPPFEVLASISRLMKDAIGEKTTREDHADVSSQLLSSYSAALEVRDLISIVGEDGLNFNQKALLTQKIISVATDIAEYSIRDHYVNLLKPLFMNENNKIIFKN